MNKILFLTETVTFEWNQLIPIVILIAISAFIPIVLSVCRIKFIPVFVIEILAGIILASIPLTKEMFTLDHEGVAILNALPEGLYMIGMALLLFLSGLDTDYSVLHSKNKDKTFNVVLLSILLFTAVVICSIGGSLIFTKYFVNQTPFTKTIGIILLVITFSSTFASVVIPLVHNAKLQHTTIGRIIGTYATLAELIAILALSGLMISMQIVEDSQPWLLVIAIGILLLTYVFKRFIPINFLKHNMEGIVHLNVRLIVLVLLSLVILTQTSGAEFILGAFLAGMVIKAANISHHTMQKMESIGYGLFVPMFYILVGLKVGLTLPIYEFIKSDNLLLIGLIFAVLVITKLPLLYLMRWYKIRTVIPTMFIVTCTLIVGIAAEHFGIFKEQFTDCLIVASCLTCLIPPLFFASSKKYGYSKDKYDEIIVNPNEVDEEGNEIILELPQ